MNKNKFIVDSAPIILAGLFNTEIEKEKRLDVAIDSASALYEKLVERGCITKTKRKVKRFVKPSLNEIQQYCLERKNEVDPHKFYNHYESNSWKVGKNPMKDWKAAVRTWERTTIGGDSKEQLNYI